jgi:hypothetical protein
MQVRLAQRLIVEWIVVTGSVTERASPEGSPGTEDSW